MHSRIFLDTETTGLSPYGDRVVEIACIADNGDEFHCYLNPERHVPDEVVRIHGLDDQFLAGKPRFAAVAARLADFVRGSEIVAHNAPFDVRFLNAEFARCGMPTVQDLGCRCVDTRAMSAALLPKCRHSLDALCQHFHISLASRSKGHGAMIDARLLEQLFHRLEALDEGGAAHAAG